MIESNMETNGFCDNCEKICELVPLLGDVNTPNVCEECRENFDDEVLRVERIAETNRQSLLFEVFNRWELGAQYKELLQERTQFTPPTKELSGFLKRVYLLDHTVCIVKKLTGQIEELESRLAEELQTSDMWESTAKRLSSESNVDGNSDYLQPDGEAI